MNNRESETIRLKGNDVLSLHDPISLWIIEEGGVAIFSAGLVDGAPEGSRKFFFSCGPGEVLFGFPPLSDEHRQAVIAVALEETGLLRLTNGDPGVAPPPPERVPATAVTHWAAVWESCVGRIGAGEPDFQEKLLRRIHLLREEEEKDRRTTAEERETRSRQATREAMDELTSVFRKKKVPAPPGSDLFVAAFVVGRSQGIRMRPPPAWDERRGVTQPVEMIAQASHVGVRRILLHHGWWRQDCGPVLAFRQDSRKPVALLPTSPRSYEMFDPTTRTASPVGREEAASIDPEAYVFCRPLPENAARGFDLMKFALRDRVRDLIVILAVACAATLLGMFTPQATALLIDHAIPEADRTLLLQLGLGLAAAAFGSALFRLAQGIAMTRVETGADSTTQSAVWDHLLKLQPSFFRRFSTGDLQSRVSAISQIRAYLSGTTLRSLFSSVALLLNFGLLLYYSPRLTLMAVVVALVSAGLTVGSGLLILRCVRRMYERQGHFFGLMVQLINGVSKLRVAAAEERAFARWAKDYAELVRLDFRLRKIQDTMMAANTILSTASTIGLFAIAATLLRGAEGGGTSLTTGVFLAFNAAFGVFIGAIETLSNTVTDVLAITILQERARPILEAEPEVTDQMSDPGRLEGAVTLDHVVFSYRDDGSITLNDVSVHAGPGKFIAFVGPSGSGKSTIFRLLLGFETPQSGVVSFDGQDLQGLDVHAVRRQLGVVLQNGKINAGSLFDNITCGSRCSLDDAWQAVRSAGFAEEVEAMPMQMHTVISEGGTNLSGGQRQRLLIARALIQKPRILLLDEATSALDNETQAQVSRSLEALQVTRVVIAHRLSTIQKADRIYVIDAGRVVQSGSFQELSAEEGLFSRLIVRQMA